MTDEFTNCVLINHLLTLGQDSVAYKPSRNVLISENAAIVTENATNNEHIFTRAALAMRG